MTKPKSVSPLNFLFRRRVKTNLKCKSGSSLMHAVSTNSVPCELCNSSINDANHEVRLSEVVHRFYKALQGEKNTSQFENNGIRLDGKILN